MLLNSNPEAIRQAFQILAEFHRELASPRQAGSALVRVVWRSRVAREFLVLPLALCLSKYAPMNLTVRSREERRPAVRQSGGAGVTILFLIAFALGCTTGVLWMRHAAKQSAGPESSVELSRTSRLALEHLPKPVEVRFYSLLDPNASIELHQFSQRVEQLLALYQQQSGGKVRVSVFDNSVNASPNAAIAEGIKGFNLDQGEGCYLGVSFSCDQRKEVLPRLLPEWNSALEADMSRAILRVAESEGAGVAAGAATSSPQLLEEVKRKIPNYQDVSLEDGKRQLREGFLKDLSTAMTELQAQVQRAQAEVQQAQGSGSAAGLDAALKQLQAAQNAQTEKLRQIAAESHAQIEAWTQIKSGSK